jgi:hypothetical protein
LPKESRKALRSRASYESSLSKTIVMVSFSGYTSGDVMMANSFYVVFAAATFGGILILTPVRGERSLP